MDMNAADQGANVGLNDLKKMDKGSFFSFDKMYFPTFARYLFIIMCALIGIVGIIGVLFGLYSMFAVGFFSGVSMILTGVITSVVMIVAMRFWFEMVLVIFSVNDAVQDIRLSIKK